GRQKSRHHRLPPRQRPRNRENLPPPRRHRHHRRRKHELPPRRLRPRSLALANLRRRHPRRPQRSTRKKIPPHPPLPPDRPKKHHGRLQGLPRPLRFQLQIFRRPYVFLRKTHVHRRPP